MIPLQTILHAERQMLPQSRSMLKSKPFAHSSEAYETFRFYLQTRKIICLIEYLSHPIFRLTPKIGAELSKFLFVIINRIIILFHPSSTPPLPPPQYQHTQKVLCALCRSVGSKNAPFPVYVTNLPRKFAKA